MEKKTQKRNSHSYKTTDVVYKKAMRRAKKEKTELAKKVEEWVSAYSKGESVCVVTSNNTTVETYVLNPFQTVIV